MSSQLNITSFDPQEIKADLISWMQTNPEFSDFNYEGSAINTIIDLLVRNSFYSSYSANVIANESFLDTAQIRANVVSHAQKLSYIPKSRTASTLVSNITVTPALPEQAVNPTITCFKGSVFLHTADNITYSFTNTEDVVLFRTEDNNYSAFDVVLKQGQLMTTSLLYNQANGYVELSDFQVDTSTLNVYVKDVILTNAKDKYKVTDDLVFDSNPTEKIFFLSEKDGKYRIEFGKDILGKEPLTGNYIELEYVTTEPTNANGLTTLISANTISGFSNITVDVTTEGYGGSERDSIDRIKFLAPKTYSSNNTAVRDFSYEAILLKNYPFIKNARAWGGETNNPPYFGQVLIAIIPEDDYVIADRVLDEIAKKMDTTNVLSITTRILNVDYFTVNLEVSYKRNKNTSNSTPQEIESYINQTSVAYSNDKLKDFGNYFNASELISLLKESALIEMVELNKVIRYQPAITQNEQKVYKVQFLNELTPGTLNITGFVYNSSLATEYIYDLDGVLYIKSTINSELSVYEVGTVDYIAGSIEFSARFSNEGNLNIEVDVVSDNFYVSQKNIVYIDELSYKEIV